MAVLMDVWRHLPVRGTHASLTHAGGAARPLRPRRFESPPLWLSAHTCLTWVCTIAARPWPSGDGRPSDRRAQNYSTCIEPSAASHRGSWRARCRPAPVACPCPTWPLPAAGAMGCLRHPAHSAIPLADMRLGYRQRPACGKQKAGDRALSRHECQCRPPAGCRHAFHELEVQRRKGWMMPDSAITN